MSKPVSDPVAKRWTIVHIEDNDANRDLVRRVLHATGRYDVVGAMDGESGLALIETERPALVLVDLDIPGVNGFEVIRQIKRSPDPRVANTPVAVVTANVITRERDEAMKAGCEAFIEKPFEIKDFRAKVAALID